MIDETPLTEQEHALWVRFFKKMIERYGAEPMEKLLYDALRCREEEHGGISDPKLRKRLETLERKWGEG